MPLLRSSSFLSSLGSKSSANCNEGCEGMLIASLIIVTVVIISIVVIIIIPKMIIIVTTSLVELADHILAHNAVVVRVRDAQIVVVVLHLNLEGFHKVSRSKHRKLRGFSEWSHEGRTKIARRSHERSHEDYVLIIHKTQKASRELPARALRELVELVRQVHELDDDKLWGLLERVQQVADRVRQVAERVHQVAELVRQVLELVQQVADRVRQVVELILSWSLGSSSRPENPRLSFVMTVWGWARACSMVRCFFTAGVSTGR